MLNSQPTETETEVNHSSIKLTKTLMNLLAVLKERHYEVFDFDAEFWISHTNSLDSGKDLRAQTYHLWRINSVQFGLDCHFSSYDLSVTVDNIKMGHDTDMQRCIWVYSGSNWEQDKESFLEMHSRPTVKCEKYYERSNFYKKYLNKVIERIALLIKKIETDYSKKPTEFKFQLPNKKMVCDTFGSYVLFLSYDEIYMLLTKQKIRLGGSKRFISLGNKLPEGVDEIAHDGFRYCPIIDHDDLLKVEVRNDCISYSSDAKYPVFFRPKFTNGLYIVDLEASGQHQDQRFNAAESIVAYHNYTHDYKCPHLLVHRDMFEDELEVPISYYKNRYHEMREMQEEWKKDYNEMQFCEKFLKSQKELITFD